MGNSFACCDGVCLPKRANKAKIVTIPRNKETTPYGTHEASDDQRVMVTPYQEEQVAWLETWQPVVVRTVDEWDYLNRFFQRFNRVELDRLAIDKERARLERENGELRNILKQYLDGISVNEDVINNPGNPLLVVNNKLHLTVEPQRQEVPHTVVEASHVVQVQRL